jgi:1-acylglycerone phosphate reductase
VELAPFDVNVITIVTGGVKSNIARIDRTLPEDSVYLPISPEYVRRTKHSQEVGMPNEKYAKQVVSGVLARNPKRNIWAGYGALLVWIASTFFPSWFLVSFGYLGSGIWAHC